MTVLVGVYGAGGCGRGIMPILREECANLTAELVFVDDQVKDSIVNGHQCLTWEKFLRHCAAKKEICLAVANPFIRFKLAQDVENNGITLRGAKANSVMIMDDVSLGAGACLSPFVTLTSNIRIGRCFHANLYSYVEHDCVIGDFVTFAPGVKCNGSVHIEDFAYVGSGAMIKNGNTDKPLVIGKGAVIGMGAVVTKDVEAGATVYGNPARAAVNS